MKTHMSLGFTNSGSGSSLGTQWVTKVLGFLQEDSKDFEETELMTRLYQSLLVMHIHIVVSMICDYGVY